MSHYDCVLKVECYMCSYRMSSSLTLQLNGASVVNIAWATEDDKMYIYSTVQIFIQKSDKWNYIFPLQESDWWFPHKRVQKCWCGISFDISGTYSQLFLLLLLFELSSSDGLENCIDYCSQSFNTNVGWKPTGISLLPIFMCVMVTRSTFLSLSQVYWT